MWTQIQALIRAELRLFLNDRRAVFLYVAVPILIASFFGFLTQGSSQRPRGGVVLWIADLDQSAGSHAVVSSFLADPTFRVTRTNAEAVRQQVLAGRAPVGLILPAGFGSNAPASLFNPDRRPELTLLHDPSRSMERQIVEGMLVPKVLEALARTYLSWEQGQAWIGQRLAEIEKAPDLSQEERRLYGSMLKPVQEWIQRQASAASTASNSAPVSLPLPFRIQPEAVTARQEARYNGFAHSFAGIGLQFVLMSMVELATGLLRERESGWFRRLRAAPVTRRTLLLSKACAYAIVASGTLATCFAFSMAAFGVRVQGSWAGFVLCLGAASAMAAALGLMLAALGRTQGGTRGISIAVILMLVMLGGGWIPSFLFPAWLQQVSLLTPTRWAVDGFDAMTWRGLGLEAASGPVLAMVAWTIAFAAVALWRFRWESE